LTRQGIDDGLKGLMDEFGCRHGVQWVAIAHECSDKS
jgi:hypothetical protein